MTQKRLEMTGAVIYWSTTTTTLSKMRAACIEIDTTLGKWIPEKNTNYASLREALYSVFPGMMVRKLKNEGFAVVREDRGDVANDYDGVASVRLVDDEDADESTDRQLSFSGCSPEQEIAIRQAFKVHRDTLLPGDVGVFLSRVISLYLDGTMLRPRSGGVYWLPEERVETWQKIANAVERAGRSTVYCLKHVMDDAAIRAVRDAIVYEVSSEAATINEKILSGELGERALQSREREAQAMIEKVQRYESLLDIGLEGVRKALGDVKDAAAAAAILASVGDDSQTTFATAND